jgi:3alpha(or 20beta)-hydroxysteroid dehydrogenase
MALELAHKGVRVNAILPGGVDTPMLRATSARFSSPRAFLRGLASAAPLKKLGAPADVARLVMFLADHEESGNITGQEIVCDGGVLARLASEGDAA